MYVYTTSQDDVLYVNHEGDLRLIAHPDQQELIEMGMEAVGVDIVHIDTNAEIEKDIDIAAIANENVGDELTKICERIMAFAEEDE
jgi:hypothetical protein